VIYVFKSISLSDSNGGYPHNRTYKITPIDHQSTTSPYLAPCNIYGAIYSGVPTAVDNKCVSFGII